MPRFLSAILAALLFATSATAARAAEQRVVKLLSPDQLLVSVGDEMPKPGQRMVLISEYTKQPIAYGEVTHAQDGLAVVKIHIHEQDGLVLPGDRVVTADLTLPSELIPGRIDLQLSGDRRFHSRYKRLAYFGSMIGDGHTLEKNETLIDVFLIAQRGITDKLTLGVVTPLFFSGVVHIGAKYKLVDNNTFIITQGVTPGWSIPGKTGFLQTRTLITIPSNSKLQSHIAFSTFVDPKNLVSSVNQGQSYVRTEIQSGYEYILDNWDRVLLGPTYNLSLKTVGGYLAYMKIWEKFHFVIGLQTQNLVDLKFNPKTAYVPSLSMFWRL